MPTYTDIFMLFITLVATISAIIIFSKYLKLKTEIKKNSISKAALEENHAKLITQFKFTLKSLDANILEYDVANDWIYSGYKNSRLKKGLNFNDYLAIHHPNDQQKIKEAFEKLLNGEDERFKFEARLFNHTNNYHWIRVYGIVSERDSEGKITKIIGLKRDSNNSIVAHHLLEKNKKRLEEYAIETQLSMQCANIVMWEYDYQTEIFTTQNTSSFISGGISKTDIISMIHPDDRLGLINAIDSFNDRNCKIRTYRTRIIMPNGSEHSYDLFATPLNRNKQGETTKITGIRIDITQQLKLNTELIELRNKAEDSNKSKSAFLANMSHEIRTPLNAIVGFSNLIAITKDPKEIEEYVAIIENNNDLLLQLINDILDLSKIEAGKLEFFMSEINAEELMKQLKQMFQLRAQDGVSVIFDAPEHNYYFNSDYNRISQVITNFLTNAIKFTAKGSIHIGFKKEETGIYFYVQDTGKGISKENLIQVFNRFSKFDHIVQGTGLGLSICKTIVERLGGKIGLESTFGEGTTSWFSIPCIPKAASSLPIKEALYIEPELLLTGDKPKILVAEDNVGNYKLYEKALKDRYELFHAWNGEEAIELFIKENPVLILMDIKMPVLDGYEAQKAIRQISPNIPIIAITATITLGKEEQERLEKGFTQFCNKPINPQYLQKIIATCLNNAKTD